MKISYLTLTVKAGRFVAPGIRQSRVESGCYNSYHEEEAGEVHCEFNFEFEKRSEWGIFGTR